MAGSRGIRDLVGGRPLKDGLRPRAIPFLIVAPTVVVLLGLAVAIVMAAFGVAELQQQSDEAAALRSRVLAETLASRLSALPPKHHQALVEQASRRTAVDFFVVDAAERRMLLASAEAPPLQIIDQFFDRTEGPVSGPFGRAFFHAEDLRGSPSRLVALVPMPDRPFATASLMTSVATFAALLIVMAAAVAWALARDVHADVMFVRTRIVNMAKEDKEPAGDPIPVRTIDQVGQLTSSFNLLLERFEAAERAYRQDLRGANAFDRDRSEFLAALSHELRTPLNAILGFTDVLLSEVDGPLSAEARENLTIVRTSGEHLRSLIDDILALSAIESGELRLSCEKADVLAIARDVVAEARVTAEQKGLALELVTHLDEPIADAYIDARRVRQVLGNVIGNAVKFTHRGYVRVEVSRDERDVFVVVSDTGPGIPKHSLQRIFDEYQQSGDPASQRSGTGLGLAITRRLVQMHGGTVRAESELGKGARFYITFPIHPPGGMHSSLPPHLSTLRPPTIVERN